jgi:hypothetical protein
MGEKVGRLLAISLPRRIICDLVHFAKKVPTVPVQRHMNLAPLMKARAQAFPRPSWCALFTKAYTMVAANRPELRRAYMSIPWAHFYEHPTSIASVAIERRWRDEDAVFFLQIRGAENHTPSQLDDYLQECKVRPIERIGIFRRSLRLARFPGFIRRFCWWLGLNLSGYYRARNWGTFAVTVYSSLGAESLHPLSPLTTLLNYGVIADDGAVDVRIIYDHRVLDGATVARALADLEKTLNGPITQSLLPASRNGEPAGKQDKYVEEAIVAPPVD